MFLENFKFISLFLITGWLFLSPAVSAQDFDDIYSDETEAEDSLKLSDKIYFGGDLSLSFGSTFFFSVAPEMGYKLWPRLHVGTGLYYMYASSRLYNYSLSVYGTRAYVRPYPLKKLFLQAEYEILNSPEFDPFYGYTDKRVFVPGFLAGLGYMEQGSGRLGFYVAILYNFTISEQTPYTNPVIRTGIIF